MTPDRAKPFLRAPRNPQEAAIYAKLIERAAKEAAEIEQIFIDCASWNENVRQPHEAPINIDPDGRLQRALEFLRKFAKESM